MLVLPATALIHLAAILHTLLGVRAASTICTYGNKLLVVTATWEGSVGP